MRSVLIKFTKVGLNENPILAELNSHRTALDSESDYQIKVYDFRNHFDEGALF